LRLRSGRLFIPDVFDPKSFFGCSDLSLEKEEREGWEVSFLPKDFGFEVDLAWSLPFVKLVSLRLAVARFGAWLSFDGLVVFFILIDKITRLTDSQDLTPAFFVNTYELKFKKMRIKAAFCLKIEDEKAAVNLRLSFKPSIRLGFHELVKIYFSNLPPLHLRESCGQYQPHF
jgi:hypothetical protein